MRNTKISFHFYHIFTMVKIPVPVREDFLVVKGTTRRTEEASQLETTASCPMCKNTAGLPVQDLHILQQSRNLRAGAVLT